MVMRSYAQTDPRFGNEGFRRVRDELLPMVAEIEGFVSYYSAYDRKTGSVTSVSIYETKDAAERSTQIAEEWGRKNLAAMGTINPQAWVGEVLVGVSALLPREG